MFLTDAELALMPYDERARVNHMWHNLNLETLVSLSYMQDAVERNENQRYEENDDPIGGWDCD